MKTKPKVLAKFCKWINADKTLRNADIGNFDAIDTAMYRLAGSYNKHCTNGARGLNDARVWYIDVWGIAMLYSDAVKKRRARKIGSNV